MTLKLKELSKDPDVVKIITTLSGLMLIAAVFSYVELGAIATIKLFASNAVIVMLILGINYAFLSYIKRTVKPFSAWEPIAISSAVSLSLILYIILLIVFLIPWSRAGNSGPFSHVNPAYLLLNLVSAIFILIVIAYIKEKNRQEILGLS